MATPGQSSFAVDGSIDTTVTLALGATVITTTLAQELSDEETDIAVVEDAHGAPRSGVMVIGDELIYYESRYVRTDLKDLARGQEGTSAATHTVGSTVKIYGPSRFANPALVEALIAAQEVISDLQTRVAALESHD